MSLFSDAMISWTPDEMMRAQELQFQLKDFLARFPMHSRIPITLQCALWAVQRDNQKNQPQEEGK